MEDHPPDGAPTATTPAAPTPPPARRTLTLSVLLVILVALLLWGEVFDALWTSSASPFAGAMIVVYAPTFVVALVLLAFAGVALNRGRPYGRAASTLAALAAVLLVLMMTGGVHRLTVEGAKALGWTPSPCEEPGTEGFRFGHYCSEND